MNIATDKEIADMLMLQHGYTKGAGCFTQNGNGADTEAPRAPTPKPQSPGPKPAERFQAFEFDNVYELNFITRPKLDLYTWQVEEQMRLSGYLDPRGAKQVPTDKTPLRYAMVAANGAGKDSMIITPFAIWCILTQVRCRVVLTSASHQQLKGQTQGYLQTFCDDFNAVMGSPVLDYIDLKITCKQTDSELIMFATDMAGKAEGWHPIEDGCWLVMILNEVKSIKEDIVRATLRCSGYTHWIEVSSPGLIDTHFYRTISKADVVYPNIPTPDQSFVRRITDDDCPHLTSQYKKALIDEFGDPNHPIVLSALKAQFMSQDTVYVIPSDLFNYDPLPGIRLGGKLRAGLDIALSADETVLSVWRGAEQIGQEIWRIRYEPTLHIFLIEAFKKYGLEPGDIKADSGGIGAPILHRLNEAGWPIVGVKNDQKAFRKIYRNRGTELWWTLRRLVQDKVLKFLPDERLMRQLRSRRYIMFDNNTMALESKKDAKARGEPSPDRADAAALAFADIDMTEVHKLALPQAPLPLGKYVIDFNGDPDEQIQGWMRGRRTGSRVSGSMMGKLVG